MKAMGCDLMECLEGIRNPCKLLKRWSGRPDSNRRRPAWEAGILPLNYSRLPFVSITSKTSFHSEHRLNTAIVPAIFSPAGSRSPTCFRLKTACKRFGSHPTNSCCAQSLLQFYAASSRCTKYRERWTGHTACSAHSPACRVPPAVTTSGGADARTTTNLSILDERRRRRKSPRNRGGMGNLESHVFAVTLDQSRGASGSG